MKFHEAISKVTVTRGSQFKIIENLGKNHGAKVVQGRFTLALNDKKTRISER